MKTNTCIVGYNDKVNRIIYIGGDSAGVGSGYIANRKDPKVFQNGNMIFGYTSSFRMGQLLRFKLKIPKQKKAMSDYEFMVTDFMDAVKKCLTDNGFSKILNNEVTVGTFLVGYKGEIYEIDDDLQVGMVYENYNAVGCGDRWAKGALYAIEDILIPEVLKPQQKIIIALEAAEKYSTGVRSPFNIVKLKY